MSFTFLLCLTGSACAFGPEILFIVRDVCFTTGSDVSHRTQQMISKTKRGIANAGVMLGMSNLSMNDSWPVKLLFHDKQKSDLIRFIQEINLENTEFMSYKTDVNELQELTPTYQQLNQIQINEQSMKNIVLLKSLENILEERVGAFQKYFDTIQKSRNSIEVFSDMDGTIRQALDTLYVYIEQELSQARQQIALNDLKRLVSESKVDAHRRSNNYMVSRNHLLVSLILLIARDHRSRE
jgi:vacuolar-type H+-ATPase subunit I/STV1